LPPVRLATRPQHEFIAATGILLSLLRIARIVIDATGVGEGVAAFLTALRTPMQIVALRRSQQEKSRIGYQLQAAAAGGHLRLNAGDDLERQQCYAQCRLARRILRPNSPMTFGVDPNEGHDDYVMSLALTVDAAAGLLHTSASGRRGAGFDDESVFSRDRGSKVRAPE